MASLVRSIWRHKLLMFLWTLVVAICLVGISIQISRVYNLSALALVDTRYVSSDIMAGLLLEQDIRVVRSQESPLLKLSLVGQGSDVVLARFDDTLKTAEQTASLILPDYSILRDKALAEYGSLQKMISEKPTEMDAFVVSSRMAELIRQAYAYQALVDNKGDMIRILTKSVDRDQVSIKMLGALGALLVGLGYIAISALETRPKEQKP